MNTPNDLYLIAEQNQGNIESIIAVYLEANELTKQYDTVKKYCMELVGAYLQGNNLKRGKTDIGSFGFTEPKPQLRLNQEKWEQAVKTNPDIYKTLQWYASAKDALELAQKDYTEEYIPESRPYIK